MPSHRATLLLVSVVDGVVAVEIITVLGQNLREHDVSLIPRSRINIKDQLSHNGGQGSRVNYQDSRIKNQRSMGRKQA